MSLTVKDWEQESNKKANKGSKGENYNHGGEGPEDFTMTIPH